MCLKMKPERGCTSFCGLGTMFCDSSIYISQYIYMYMCMIYLWLRPMSMIVLLRFNAHRSRATLAATRSKFNVQHRMTTVVGNDKTSHHVAPCMYIYRYIHTRAKHIIREPFWPHTGRISIHIFLNSPWLTWASFEGTPEENKSPKQKGTRHQTNK